MGSCGAFACAKLSYRTPSVVAPPIRVIDRRGHHGIPVMASSDKGRATVDVNSSFGIISWIIFGALAGWVASMIAGDNARQGWFGNIIVGIVGAFIGGLLFSLVGGGTFTLGWSIGSFVAAVIGAIILLFILRMFQGRA